MAEPPRQPYTGMPRWVKVSGLIAIILALTVVIVLLVSGGEHGPRRHLPGGHTPPVEHGP